MDAEGYPEEAELAKIRGWDHRDPRGLMDYVRERWHMADWGWKQEDKVKPEARLLGERWYHISTGGWSGNESIVEAMQENQLFWTLSWYSSRRGGHYEFRVRHDGSWVGP